MPQTELKATVRKMIQVELDAMHYYLKATEALHDEGAIFNFNLLADEEREHARSFYQIYPGDDLPPFNALLLQSETNPQEAPTIDIALIPLFDERQALQLAMELEKDVEGNLRKMATEIKNPEARAVIEQNTESTLSHYELIAADYSRLYESDKGD